MITPLFSVGTSLSALLPKEVLPQTLPPTFVCTPVLLGSIHQCWDLSHFTGSLCSNGLPWPSSLSPAMWCLCSSSWFPHGYSVVPSLSLSAAVSFLQSVSCGMMFSFPSHFTESHFFPVSLVRASALAWHCPVVRTLCTGLFHLSYTARMLFR